MYTNINNTKQFEHDCDNCVFLGNALEADLYVCVGSMNTTVIARYGDDGPDYISGTDIAELDTRLAVAFTLAVKKGYDLLR